ncbi:hypothetical protein HanRHA438_Chr12g0562461 [Helianthus annuus]|nr:hypothetical protein HanRHA438_Chr12g0562461 [Helianthus annuus]
MVMVGYLPAYLSLSPCFSHEVFSFIHKITVQTKDAYAFVTRESEGEIECMVVGNRRMCGGATTALPNSSL